MANLFSYLLAILSGLLAIPSAALCLEIGAGLLRPKISVLPNLGARWRVAVLVPAHNESAGIAATLSDIKAQLREGDDLLVIADNCNDDTAAVALASGAEVVERNDSERIGKGYALDWGLRHLESNPPEIVVMIDADCRLADGAIDQLASTCLNTQRPVQALYLMTRADGSQINQQIAEFAWRVKNWVRPLGLRALNLPCQLMGTGMAFPWHVIRGADLATGWIVEDLKLGLDLTAAGYPPVFCPSARVLSQFAGTARGAEIQRDRWERGHIETIVKYAARLSYAAVSRGNFNLLALALDLTIPPLSLLLLLLLLMVAITGVATLLGPGSIALAITTTCLVGFAISVVLAWAVYGREVLSARAILSLPNYIIAKLNIYHRALIGRIPARWIRTDRTKP